MTTARQLFSLQELDLTLDRIQEALAEAEKELNSGRNLDQVEAKLQEEDERLTEVRGRHRLQQSEAESQRERSTRLDAQLYGGDITNPRDLESLEQEANHARQSLEQQDSGLLELSMQAEESQERRDTLERELTEARAAWQDRQAELQIVLERCAKDRETVSSQRQNLAATLEQSAVNRYEGLRRAKGGLGVAKVERGLCQACRMALPTQLQQRVRSGRQTVLCSSCGRILFLS